MSDPSRETSDPGTVLFDRLSTEPRLTRIEDFRDDCLVARGELPSGDGNGFHSRLMVFGEAGSGWELRGVVSGRAATCLTGGRIAYVSPEVGATAVHVLLGTEPPRKLLVIPGQIAGMVGGPTGLDLYLLCRNSRNARGAGPRDETFSGATIFAGVLASVGKVRFRSDGWRLLRIDCTDGDILLDVALAFEPTGEILVLENGEVLVGAISDGDIDGRHGFIRLAEDGAERGRIFAASVALSGVVQVGDGDALVCAGVYVARPDGGLRQRLFKLLEGAPPEEIARGDQLWHRPVGMAGADVVVTLAEQFGRRGVFLHDVRRSVTEPVPIDESVWDARVSKGRIACITSSISRMPSLILYDLVAPGRLERILEARVLNVGGTIQQVRQPVDRSTELASWLCRPSGEISGLVAIFHGGPCKTWADWPWRWNPWPLVAAGYAVVLPDPPMSLGYGDRAIDLGWRQWRTGIAKHAAAQVAGVRASLGIADRPLTLMGGSFGGYLALAVAELMHPDLVVSHGAPTNLAQVALGSEVWWQWVREYGWPDPNDPAYHRESLFDLDSLRGTRVLLTHGLNDDLVPVTEAVGLHRRLRWHNVNAELAVFGDEYHGVTRIGNQQDWFRWVLGAMRALSQPGPGGTPC